MPAFFVPLFTALLASSAHADEATISETRAVPTGQSDAATQRLALHLYVFRGSRWETDTVAAIVPAAGAVLAQCGIGIERAQLHIVDAPAHFRSYSTPVSRQLMRAMAVTKPAVFFVDETLNRPAYDAEAIGLANSRTRPELAHTIWVAYGTRDLPVALAHELVHILSNSGAHSDEPGNLMREETSWQNTKLAPDQCEQARERGNAQGLLTSRRRQ
ncbi:MAG: hypothetical protein ACM3SS_08375 [Rhodospirillaceae bacterium]